MALYDRIYLIKVLSIDKRLLEYLIYGIDTMFAHFAREARVL